MRKQAKEIAYKAIAFINENIAEFKDFEGKKFLPYTFPYWWKKYKSKLEKKLKRTRKTKKPIEKFKEKAIGQFQQNAHRVTLADSGLMLASMVPIKIEENQQNEISITIGFKQKEASERAIYHNFSGAGKNRKLRRFLGISREQTDELAEYSASLFEKDADFVKKVLENKLFKIES